MAPVAKTQIKWKKETRYAHVARKISRSIRMKRVNGVNTGITRITGITLIFPINLINN